MLRIKFALIVLLSIGSLAMFCDSPDPETQEETTQEITTDAGDLVGKVVTKPDVDEEKALAGQGVTRREAENFIEDMYPFFELYWQECAQFIMMQGGRSLEDAYARMDPEDVSYFEGVGYKVNDTFFDDSPVLWWGRYGADGTLAETWVVNWPIPLNRCQ